MEVTCDSANKYAAGGMKHTFHGLLYQLKLLMLFLIRGIKQSYFFKLATEMKEAESFNDIVFEYMEGDQKVYIFVQAKHKQDDKRKIKVGDLLTRGKSGEFKLLKYFISYLKIKSNKYFNGCNLKEFIICTNIDFQFEEPLSNPIRLKRSRDQKQLVIEKINTDHFFFSDSGTRYKFYLNEDTKLDLIKLFKSGIEDEKIKNKTFTTDGNLREEIENFFNKLIFAVDQPNEENLKKIIIKELSKTYVSSDPENVYLDFKEHMENWLKKKGGSFLTQEDGNRFLGDSFTGREEQVEQLRQDNGIILRFKRKYEEAANVKPQTKKIYKKRKKYDLEHKFEWVKLYNDKNYDDALEMLQKVYEENKEDKQSDLQFEMDVLIQLLTKKCRYIAAIEMCKERYRRHKQNNPELCTTLKNWLNVGLELAKQNKYEESRQKLDLVLQVSTKLLKSNNPIILATRKAIFEINKAKVKGTSINFAMVDDNYKQIKEEKTQDLLGTIEKRDILAIRKGLDILRDSLGSEDDEAFKIIDLRFDLDFWTILVHWFNAALQLAKHKKNNYKKSLDELETVLKKSKKLFKPNNPFILSIKKTIDYIRQEKIFKLEGVGDLINESVVNPEAASVYTSPLHIAARNGFVDIVIILIKAGAQVDCKDNEDWTPIYYAAEVGHLEVLNILLRKGASFNTIDYDGVTPLMCAKIRNQEIIVKRLLESDIKNNMNINIANNRGVTQLHYAAQLQDVNILRWLLKLGPNIEATDINGWTPLHYAAYYGRLNIVVALLMAGANTNATSHDFKTPLDYARQKGHDEVSQVLSSTSIYIYYRGKSEILQLATRDIL